MGIRRVTTAKDAAGKSVFLEDAEVEALTLQFLPGVEFFLLSGGDTAPEIGPGATAPTARGFFPGEGGYRLTVSTIPAATTVRTPEGLDKKAAIAELQQKLPGLLSASEREPGMHTSHTLDLVVILDGDVTLELDDGAKVDLEKGDLVVQIGARHRWSNRGTETAVLLSAMIGARGAAPTI